VVRQLRDSLFNCPDEVVEAINRRMSAMAKLERFEEASVHRDRLAAFVRAAARTQRLSALTRCPEVVAARREDDGRWSVHVVRFGRLVAAGVIPSGADAHQFVHDLRASAETVRPAAGPVPAASAEESEKVLRWLESPGIRLVDVDGEWVCPLGGASRHLALYDSVNQSRLTLVPFDEQRGSLRPQHQPAR
jgi:DNA polymerase III subunit epsilon